MEELRLKQTMIIVIGAVIAIVSSVAIVSNDECNWTATPVPPRTIHYAKTCGGTLQTQNILIPLPIAEPKEKTITL